MKCQDELNALLLLVKNYERLKAIEVKPYNDSGEIKLENVPRSMLDYFTEKISELVTEDVETAAALVEQAALKYAAAATKED